MACSRDNMETIHRFVTERGDQQAPKLRSNLDADGVEDNTIHGGDIEVKNG